MSSIPHGTFSGYNYHRCRCQECRAVKNQAKREQAARRRAAGIQCQVTGCSKVVAGASAYCSAHRARVESGKGVGSAVTRTNDGFPRSYTAAHRNVDLMRGGAKSHQCADCGTAASEWSLMHEASTRVTVASGVRAGMEFSPYASDYEPRCKPCHTVYDGMRRKRELDGDAAEAPVGA